MVFFDTQCKSFRPLPNGAEVENGVATIGEATYKVYTVEQMQAFFASRDTNTRGQIAVAEDGSAVWVYIDDTPEEKRAAYEQKADSLIREKYTISQELSILRQRDEKPEEYAEYYAYCEQCKTTARAEIYGGETQ